MGKDIGALPAYVNFYLDTVLKHRPEASVHEERRVCEALWDTISKEKDESLRMLMTERFEKYCRSFADSNPVLLSYIYSERWEDEVEEDRKLLARPLQLYLRLEYIVSQCSESSFTRSGRNSRYPLSVRRSDGTIDKMGITPPPEMWHPSEFPRAYYQFGSHKLFIGVALARICDYLERRYGLDFRELEENRQRKAPR